MHFPQKQVIEVTHIDETFIHIENVVYKRHDSGNEKQELRIIETQSKVIEELVKMIEEEKESKLRAKYFINDYKFFSSTMATITIPQDKNSVNGQLVPTNAGNPLDLSFIQPDTDAYSSSDPNIATISKTGNGTFVVSRVAPGGGTVNISYTANNSQGNQISGGDTIVLDAVVVPPVVADGLTATFSEPQ